MQRKKPTIRPIHPPSRKIPTLNSVARSRGVREVELVFVGDFDDAVVPGGRDLEGVFEDLGGVAAWEGGDGFGVCGGEEADGKFGAAVGVAIRGGGVLVVEGWWGKNKGGERW